jgi:hydrogenase nickel incorporation protein HypA/HybF
MSIAMNVIEIVRDTVGKQEKAGEVRAIHLRIGKFRAVVPESLAFCFEAIVKGTPLEGALLHIDEIPVRVSCRDCGTEVEKTDPVFVCAHCGSPQLDIISGMELEIHSIEVID